MGLAILGLEPGQAGSGEELAPDQASSRQGEPQHASDCVRLASCCRGLCGGRTGGDHSLHVASVPVQSPCRC